MKSIFKTLQLFISFKATKTRAEQGLATAQNLLGSMYEGGEGVAQNFEEAARWYRLAAEQGNANALMNLGRAYGTGRGLAQNDQEAARLYRLAAGQGDLRAQIFLGQAYEKGIGVTQNNSRAYVWFSVTTAQGWGAEDRDRIRTRLSPQALEQAQAMATRCFESGFKDCE